LQVLGNNTVKLVAGHNICRKLCVVTLLSRCCHVCPQVLDKNTALLMQGIMLIPPPLLCAASLQVLDKNTVKLVAGEFDLLVVDKEEAGVTAGAVKQRDFLELEDLDDAVSCYMLHHMLFLCYVWSGCNM
jgi:hypothetical protein